MPPSLNDDATDANDATDATAIDASTPPEPGALTPPAEDGPTFASLGLESALQDALEDLGFKTPTPIQSGTIPVLLEGRDIIGQAQTGTGKTAAFGLPLLQTVDASSFTVQGLVLAPTRELALQVTDALEGLGRHVRGLRVLTVYGGAPIGLQLRALNRGVHVVVGTPGRVADCLRRGALDLTTVRFVALDEADEMLQMGFLEDVEAILEHTPEDRQTALFSATMPVQVRRIADRYLTDAETVKPQAATRTAADITQTVVVTRLDDKFEALARVLEAEQREATVVFVRTKAGCRELSDSLESRGFAVAPLHGDLSQAQREDVMRRLRDGRIDLVVATDVAARGLDVERITHVVNFDPPQNPEIYTHRIGRTGRAGRSGVSILLLTPRERRIQANIERYTRQPMVFRPIPSNAEVARGRAARVEAAVAALGEDAKALKPYRKLVAKLAEARSAGIEASDVGGSEPAEGAPAGDALLDVAAALAMALSTEWGRPLTVNELEPRPVPPLHAPKRPRPEVRGVPHDGPHGRRGDRGGERAGERPPRRGETSGLGPPGDGPSFMDGPGEGRARLFISLGRNVGLRPGDIVGAIANEAGLPGREIGPISIRERVSFVDVPAEAADHVIKRLAAGGVKGKRAHVSFARPPGQRFQD